MIRQGKRRAWITGASGLIGSHLLAAAPALAGAGWQVRGLTRAGLDLLDFGAVTREFQRDAPELVLHCAALTVVREAQEQPELARRLNCEVTRHLAGLAGEGRLVFFSTDLVFDGRRGGYTETDPVNPLTVYGETKAVAEQIVLANPRHLVVRTSLNGGISPAGNRGFNEQLRAALTSPAQVLTLFTDEFRCPIPAVETARAVWELALQECTGLYQVAGAEKLSRWETGRLLARRWPALAGRIQPGSARDYAGPPRALDTSLNVQKVQRHLSRPLPGLGGWLVANPQAPF